MKILVVSAHTKSLLWFRMDMMEAFLIRGFEVVAVGPDPEVEWVECFARRGVRYVQVPMQRNGVNPAADLRTFAALVRLISNERPTKVFAFMAKPVVYASLAARLVGVSQVYPLIGGLGSVIRGSGIRNRSIATVVKIQYWAALKCADKLFLQNNDDKQWLINSGLVDAAKIVLLNGSGVNLSEFALVSMPARPAIIFVGRLIRDKGVLEYLEACREIRRQFPGTRCLLVGPYDSNPSALRPQDLEPYLVDGTVEYFGEREDVRPLIAEASVFVLPSYHEGTPKSVLEAMSMGRPVVTTDAPGCRDTVVPGVSGHLVPVRDTQGLVEAIAQLLADPERAASMGLAGRRRAETKYDVEAVNGTILTAMGIT